MDTETMFAAYVECALWSSLDDQDEPLDAAYDADDIDADSLASMRDDVDAFAEANADDLESISADQAGHDFWLTRNGHGAGFWDRGLGELGDRLTKACRPYGESYLSVRDDGKVELL